MQSTAAPAAPPLELPGGPVRHDDTLTWMRTTSSELLFGKRDDRRGLARLDIRRLQRPHGETDVVEVAARPRKRCDPPIDLGGAQERVALDLEAADAQFRESGQLLRTIGCAYRGNQNRSYYFLLNFGQPTRAAAH